MDERDTPPPRPQLVSTASSKHDIPSRSPRPRSTASFKPNNLSRTLLADHCIRRIATDPSITLGSFYDARTESVVGRLSLHNKIITKASQTRDIQCVVKRADSFDREDVFRIIGIHEEPWLSSILNLVPLQGVTALTKYPFSRSSNTRYLYYYYCSEEQSISQMKDKVIAAIPKNVPTITTTHVVSTMKVGVQAFIVLQLPPDDDAKLDGFLESTDQKLSNIRFRMSTNDKSLFNRMIVTEVFSNIPNLSTSTVLADICQKLMDIRPHVYRHCPLEFTLRTIDWFYPSYPTRKAPYIALEPRTVKIILEYLLALSSTMEELKISLDSEDEDILEKHIHDPYSAVRQQIEDARHTYSNELERYRDLVIQIRTGKIQQELIVARLPNELLNMNINPLIERFRALRRKAKLIKTLNEGKIEYLNMQRYSIHKSDDLKTILHKLCKQGDITYVFCSTDEIKDQDYSKWSTQREKWMKKIETNPLLAFVYADFTYTSYHLPEVKILELKSPGSNDKQVESTDLTTPLTPEEDDLSREQTLSPPTQADAISVETKSPRGKTAKNVDEKHKSREAPAESEILNTLNNQFHETEKSTHSASLPDEPTTSPESGQSDDAKKQTNSPPSSPVPSVEKDEQTVYSKSTCQSPQSQSIVSSKEPTNDQGKQCDTPQPSMVPLPLVTPRDRHSKGSSTSIITAEPFSTELSFSAERVHHIGARNSVSTTFPSATEPADEQSKIQSEEKGERTAWSSLITPSTSKQVQVSKRQYKEIDELPRPSSAPVSTKSNASSSRNNQLGKVSGHTTRRNSSTRLTTDISIKVEQKNGDHTASPDALISPRHTDLQNMSSSIKGHTSLRDLTHPSGSSARSHSQSAARQRRHQPTSASRSNPEEESHSLIVGKTTSLTDQNNNRNELIDTSVVPRIGSPRPTLQREKESTSINQYRKSPPPKPAFSAENQSKNTHERSDQLGSEEPPRKGSFSSPEWKPDHSRTQTDSQTSRRPSTGQSEGRPTSNSNSSRPSPVKYINILLLGASGVGKSTFINALINYQAFQTFEQARSSKPLVAMPVSFLITVGHHFEEKIVRFGGVDPNEDHEHPGQSVTQHCRSYIFHIDPETRLRIIDTPGMGDTRGIDQDDQNMQHILSFISNLPHLDAICILLKPNESRLNVLLRSYFTRLLNFLGDDARHNIVFCFTNTRSTFFAPGDTGPLLRKMLRSLPINDIAFEKRNTFCFDSESFRYLVILRNNIEFDSYQEEEYEKSWTASSTTANRLIQYIRENLEPYPQSKWQSTEHAHFQINQLIRPLLETTRNILRNINLLRQRPPKLLIKLRPIALSEPSVLCYTHPRTPQRFVDFWILPDQLHSSTDRCNTEDTHRRKHLDVSYKLEYELIEYSDERSFQEMRSNLNQLHTTIVGFGEFYGYVVDTLKQKDPMLSALKQIIAEEDQICSAKGAKCLNSTLRDIFTALREEYTERRTSSTSTHMPVDLAGVYEQMKRIRNISEIKEQVEAVQATQNKYIKQHEKRVSHV